MAHSRSGRLLAALVLSIAACAFFSAGVQAQHPSLSNVSVQVSPDRADWTYRPGDPVTFRIDVLRDGHQVTGATVTYEYGPEMMPPVTKASAVVGTAPLTVAAGTMKEPGFLRLAATVEIEGRTIRGVATAGFSPESIQPTQTQPADFDAFWAAERQRLAELPLDARWTPLPDYGTALADCWQINIQNVGTTSGASRLYGILCMPKAPGRYPALLSVPGAGVRPYRGLADMAGRGLITFQIGIHGIPVIQPQEVYDSLSRSGVDNYPTYGLDSRERYYFRRVYTGTVRANDFLVSLPQWNGRGLGVTGGSQGGQLSLVTAALDNRVTHLAAFYPAYSDVTGYLHNRAGGWPHMFRPSSGVASHRTPEKLATSAYYDAVNFARRIKVPGLYSWGYNDEVTPPTTLYAAYNVIAAPKTLLLAYQQGHATTPAQSAAINDWLVEQLQGAR